MHKVINAMPYITAEEEDYNEYRKPCLNYEKRYYEYTKPNFELSLSPEYDVIDKKNRIYFQGHHRSDNTSLFTGHACAYQYVLTTQS